MKKKTMADLIAIVVVVVVLISAGVVYKGEKLPGPVSTQDVEYLRWDLNTWDLESAHLELLRNAALRLDFGDMELYVGMLYDDANKALDEIDQFSVSPWLQPSKDEFKLSQQDLRRAGYYIERGARNIDVDDIKTAVEYFERFTKHLERSNALLPSFYKERR